MAVSPTPPSLSILPPAPLPTDAEAVFDAKAGARLTAEEVMVTEQNAALAWQAGSMAETKGYMDAAATSAGNAADSAAAAADSATAATNNGAAQVQLAADQVALATDQVTLAAEQVGLAEDAREASEALLESTQVVAAAAQSAAGLPSLIGHGGQALCAKTDETGVEFKALGQAVGDTLVTARTPDATYLPADGSIYLQSAWPELFAVLGKLTGLGSFAQRVLPSSSTWVSVAYGNGVFVAIANTGAAATSPDGITWTARTLPATATWRSVAYGAGVFMAVVSDGIAAATSPDGITWTARTLPATATWRSVAYGNGAFAAIAYNSAIAASASAAVYDRATQFITPTLASPEGAASYIKAKVAA